MFSIIIAAVFILLVTAVIILFIAQNRDPTKHIIKFIEKKYEDTWGTVSSLNILGIHHLAEFKRNSRHVYLVVMLRNGKLVHSLSEVKIRGKNMSHRRMSNLEKNKFLSSNPTFNQEYSKIMRIYENY